jgi:hypothetical protein
MPTARAYLSTRAALKPTPSSQGFQFLQIRMVICVRIVRSVPKGHSQAVGADGASVVGALGARNRPHRLAGKSTTFAKFAPDTGCADCADCADGSIPIFSCADVVMWTIRVRALSVPV